MQLDYLSGLCPRLEAAITSDEALQNMSIVVGSILMGLGQMMATGNI